MSQNPLRYNTAVGTPREANSDPATAGDGSPATEGVSPRSIGIHRNIMYLGQYSTENRIRQVNMTTGIISTLRWSKQSAAPPNVILKISGYHDDLYLTVATKQSDLEVSSEWQCAHSSVQGRV